jgi:predicted dienelactone hydrolase
MVDASRDRTLRVDIWYPADSIDGLSLTGYSPIPSIDFTFPSEVAYDSPNMADGSFPLIASSHGTKFYSTAQASVNEHLASHGFVVAAPNHTLNSRDDVFNGTNISETAIAPDRPTDISFVLDQMIDMSGDEDSRFFGRIDSDKIGATGLSFGGVTTFATHTGSSAINVEPDERIKAIMPMSSGAYSWLGLSERNLDVTIPTLMVNGSADPTRSSNSRAFNALTVEPRYQVIIDRAYHLSSMDVCDWRDYADANNAPDALTDFFNEMAFSSSRNTCASFAIDNNEAIKLTGMYAVSFFNTHLNDELGYTPYLTQDFADTMGFPTAVTAFPERVPGDVNGDLTVDSSDIDQLIGAIATNDIQPIYDLNSDGELNENDIDQWLADAATSLEFMEPLLRGDSNLDGMVNSVDLNALGLRWQTSDSRWTHGDFTGDGLTDAQDLNVLAVNWQKVVLMSAGIMAVPEPSGVCVFVAALFLLLARVDKRFS